MNRAQAEKVGWDFTGDEDEQIIQTGANEFRTQPGHVTAKRFDATIGAYRELSGATFAQVLEAIQAVETELASRANADATKAAAEAAKEAADELADSQWSALDARRATVSIRPQPRTMFSRSPMTRYATPRATPATSPSFGRVDLRGDCLRLRHLPCLD
jgi:hypothetical protein